MMTFLTGTLPDLRLAIRSLRRSPGFALGVIVVLALGIGASAAMFTVLRATVLRPLLYRQPGRLVCLETMAVTGEAGPSRIEDVLVWRARTHTVRAMAYFNTDLQTLNSGYAEQEVGSVNASAELFSTLGTPPALGRVFTAGEQQPGKEHVVVLSDAVWREQFYGEPSVLGRTVRLNDELFTVIGVMPRGFEFPVRQGHEAQVWEPVPLKADNLTRDFRQVGAMYEVIARRAPGNSIADVAHELTEVQQSLLPLYDKSIVPEELPARVEATDLRHTFEAKQRKALVALSGAVALLWLIACADVASLYLARAASRRREFAVRSSLGATRLHLGRQMLVESLLLSCTGGVVGLLLSQCMLAFFRHQLLQTFGDGLQLHVDGLVLTLLFALSILSAVLLSVFATWSTLRGPIEAALRTDGAQAGTGVRQQRLQRFLVVGELAVTLCLLVGCGLLARTVLALQQVPLGFRTDHVFSITPHLPFYKYSKLDPNTLVLKPLAARLATLPGVESLAVTSVAPLAGRFDVNYTLMPDEKQMKGAQGHALHAKLRAAGPELQKVLGFRMLQGRFFNAADSASAQPVAVVNKAFAKEWSSTGSDLSHFTLGHGDRTFHMVGVVDDFHQQGIAEAAAPEIDLNAAQLRPSDGFYQPTLEAHAEILLRSSRNAQSLLPELRHTLGDINPDLAGAEIQTMDQIVEDAMGGQLLAAHLLELLGGLALLVALTGLYSLLAYTVTLRTRELGVRLALGAQRGDVLRLVLRGAGGLLALGVGLGLLLSLAGAHLLSRFLYGVTVYDLRTFAVAAMALLLVGLAAALIPAQRAAATEPTEALRAE